MKKFIILAMFMLLCTSLLAAVPVKVISGSSSVKMYDSNGKLLNGNEADDVVLTFVTENNSASLKSSIWQIELGSDSCVTVSQKGEEPFVNLSYGSLMIENTSGKELTVKTNENTLNVKDGESTMVFANKEESSEVPVITPVATSSSTSSSKSLFSSKMGTVDTKQEDAARNNLFQTESSGQKSSSFMSGKAPAAAEEQKSKQQEEQKSISATGLRFSVPASADSEIRKQGSEEGVKEVPTASPANNFVEYEPDEEKVINFGADVHGRLNFLLPGETIWKQLKNYGYFSVVPFFEINKFRVALRLNRTLIDDIKDKNFKKVAAYFNILDEISYKGKEFKLTLDRTTEFGFSQHIMNGMLSHSFDYAYTYPKGTDTTYGSNYYNMFNESPLALNADVDSEFIKFNLFTDTLNFRAGKRLYGGARVSVLPYYKNKLEFGVSTLYSYNSSIDFFPSIDTVIPLFKSKNLEYLLKVSATFDANGAKGDKGFAFGTSMRGENKTLYFEAGFAFNFRKMLTRAMDNSRQIDENLVARDFVQGTVMDIAGTFGYKKNIFALELSAAVPFKFGNNSGLYIDKNGTSVDKFTLQTKLEFNKNFSLDIGINELGLIGRLKGGYKAQKSFLWKPGYSDLFLNLALDFDIVKTNAKIAYYYNTEKSKSGVYLTIGAKVALDKKHLSKGY